MEMVREMLTKSRANRGSHVPQLLELLQALADRRPLYTNTLNSSGGSSSSPPPSVTRFYCKTPFVDIVHGTCHLVHPRCAHLCDAYQKGQSSMEDIPLYSGGRTCSLCQGSGATVKCYHPDCKEEYHVICALFSHGYVNFGKRDPMLPAPACPKHTQVKCPTLHCRDENITAVDRKRRRDEEQSDNVVFDSAVVQKGDLRDPDEELEGGW
ncbi:zinc finger protein, putative [Bodo saltans]|uniref:Zinc finger protein, putative n=1 Tax=Bodo saltans TaxID=75058 RepID=A0A0S4J809_BODSA|nr:zinc finger protein, putative [Bodo saltans]|eukprot:CUG86299.1 zinc finger protein, putative [Bodo saltans]